MSSTKDSSSISPLTSTNYRLWADDMKSWLQLNGLWCLVSGQEKKPVAKPEVKDHKGQVVSKAVDVDEGIRACCWNCAMSTRVRGDGGQWAMAMVPGNGGIA
jgi:hypothetical protein